MVRLKPKKDRLFLTEKEKQNHELQIKKLCDYYKIPYYISEILLTEIKKDNNPKNEHFKNSAKILGLV